MKTQTESAMATNKYNKLTIFFFLTTIAFLVATVNFWSESSNLKFELKSIDKIPHAELRFSAYESKQLGYMVDVTGFVVFENPDDQPKDMRQYNKIETNFEFDFDEGTFVRTFTGEDIIKMKAIEPRSLGEDVLAVREEDSEKLVLENEYGVIFIIDKSRQQVDVVDAQGDATFLITSFWDYQNFIEKRFYK